MGDIWQTIGRIASDFMQHPLTPWQTVIVISMAIGLFILWEDTRK